MRRRSNDRRGLGAACKTVSLWVLIEAVFFYVSLPYIHFQPVRSSPISISFGPPAAEAAPPTAFEAPEGVAPEIQIARMVTPAAADGVVDGRATITYTIMNQTSDALSGVLVTTALAPGASYASATPPANQKDAELAWSLGSLAPFASTTIELELEVGDTPPAELDTGADVYATRVTRPLSAGTLPAAFAASGVDPALLACTVDADCNDPFVLAKAAELGYDPDRIFAFVRDEISFESYVGSLRGARGTLFSEAGNALDQSSLLVALLRACGVPARYVSGTLDLSSSQALILSMFPAPRGLVGVLFEEGQADSGPFADPGNDAELLAEVQQHTWVELVDGVVTRLDPALRASVDPAPVTDVFSEVPDELRHKIGIRLDVERFAGDFRIGPLPDAGFPEPPLEVTLSAPEVYGRMLTLQHFVSSTGPLGVGGVTLVSHEYTPLLLVSTDSGPGREIVGDPYQELLFGVQGLDAPVSGIFLTLRTETPGEEPRLFRRALFDSVGFASRRLGTAPTLLDRDVNLPAIDLADSTVIMPLGGRLLGRAMANALARGEQLVDEVQQLTSGEFDPELNPQRGGEAIVLATEARSIAAAAVLSRFYKLSDAAQVDMSQALRTRIYPDRPRIAMAGFRLDPREDTSTDRFFVDLIDTRSRPVSAPGVPLLQEASALSATGSFDLAIEGSLLDPISDPAFTSSVISATEVLDAARAQGIELGSLTPSEGEALNPLEIPNEAKIRIRDALDRGASVLLPTREPIVDQNPAMAWLEMDPDGYVVGRLQDGSGGLSGSPYLLRQLLLDKKAGRVAGFGLTSVFTSAFGLLLFSQEVLADGLPDKKESVALASAALAWAIAISSLRCTQLLVKSAAAVTACQEAVAKTGAALAPVLVALRTVDPPVGRVTLGALAPVADNTAQVELEATASLDLPSLDAAFTTRSVSLERATRLQWESDLPTGIEATSLLMEAATVRNELGEPVGTGRLTLSTSVPVPVELRGQASYSLVGDLALSAYAPALATLGTSIVANDATASVVGSLELELSTGSLVLNGTVLAEGRYSISTGAIEIDVDGVQPAPTFSERVSADTSDATLRFGGASSLQTDLGLPTVADIVLTGVNGSFDVVSEGASDRVGGAAVASDALAVYVEPPITSASSTQSATQTVTIAASITDSFLVTAEGPVGWRVDVDDQGVLSATPPSGTPAGDYRVFVTAESTTKPALRGSAEATVRLGPGAPGVALELIPDPTFSVPVDGALLGSSFRANISNIGPFPDQFDLQPLEVPGFEVFTSTERIDVPPLSTGIVGLYLRPVGPIPPPGTNVPFEVSVEGSMSGSTSATALFVVPAVRSVALGATELQVVASPGGTASVSLTLSSAGNVPARVALSANSPTGFAVSGLPSPFDLATGDDHVTVVSIGVPSGAAPNESFSVEFIVDFCVDLAPEECVDPGADLLPTGPGLRTVVVAVSVRSAELAELDQAIQAARELDPALQSTLIGLVRALGQIANGGDPGLCVGARERVDALLSAAPTTRELQSVVSELEALRAAADVCDPTALAAASASLGTALLQAVNALARHAFTVQVTPDRGTLGSQDGAVFSVRLESQGSEPTTFDLSLEGLPAAVNGAVEPATVVLQPGEVRDAASAEPIEIVLDPIVEPVGAFSLGLVAVPREAPALAQRVFALVETEIPEANVTGVEVEPRLAVDENPVAVRANVVNSTEAPRQLRGRLELIGVDGDVIDTPFDADVTLAGGLAPQVLDLGSVATVGLPNGSYELRFTLLTPGGERIGSAASGSFAVGQLVSLSASVEPSLVSPADGAATAVLEIRNEVPRVAAATALDQVCQNLLVNAEFDQGPPNAGVGLSPSNPLPGWTKTGTGTARHVSGTEVRLGAGTGLAQTVGTVPGEPYLLYFEARAFSAPTTLPRLTRLEASVADVSEVFVYEFNPFLSPRNPRVPAGIRFTATDSQSTVAFTYDVAPIELIHLERVVLCPLSAAGVSQVESTLELLAAQRVESTTGSILNPEWALGAPDLRVAELAPGAELVLDLAPVQAVDGLEFDFVVVTPERDQSYTIAASEFGDEYRVLPPESDNSNTPVLAAATRRFDLRQKFGADPGVVPIARFVKITAGSAGLALDAVSVANSVGRERLGIGGQADFVFVMDASSSLDDERQALRAGFSNFIAQLDAQDVDARFALIRFAAGTGGPALLRDFTSHGPTFVRDLQNFPVQGGVEAGLEGVRAALNATALNADGAPFDRSASGGVGPLAYRPNARKNIILVTDENSELPAVEANRIPGQTSDDPPNPPLDISGTAWETEVAVTAQALVDQNAFLNLVVLGNDPLDTADEFDLVSLQQYGDPDVETQPGAEFDPAVAYAALQAAGRENTLQGRVLEAGLVARAFDVERLAEAGFVDGFFAAKVAETVNFRPQVTLELRHSLATAGNTFDIGAIAPAPIIDGDDLVFTFQFPFFELPDTQIEIPAQVAGLLAGQSRELSTGTSLSLSFTQLDGTTVSQSVQAPALRVVAPKLVAIDPPLVAIPAGSSADYSVTLTNPVSEAVEVSLSSLSLAGLSADLPASVTLAPGATQVIPLTITAPATAPTQMRTFGVRAETPAVVDSASAELEITAVEGPAVGDVRAVFVDVTPVQPIAGQGTPATFQARVVNVGSVSDAYALVVTAPTGFGVELDADAVELAPGQAGSRIVRFAVTPPTGTSPGSYPVALTATSASDPAVQGTDADAASVVTAGVTVDFSPSQAAPSDTITLRVTNTGATSDDFDLALGGPAGGDAVLGSSEVSLASGAFVDVPVALGGLGFAVPGDLSLVGTATSQSSPEVMDSALASIAVPPGRGVTAELTPMQTEVSQPQTVPLNLAIDNTGNRSDSFRVEITTSGGIGARLLDAEGRPTLRIDSLDFPALAGGVLDVVAEPLGMGTGTIFATVTSLSDPTVVATTSATITLENQAPVADAGPDRNALAETVVELDGSASFDRDGDLLAYQWSLVSAPPGSALTEADVIGLDTPRPRFTPEVLDLRVDFVFLVDTSESMEDEIAMVRSGLSSFIANLEQRSIDARFAIVNLTEVPSLLSPFTADPAVVMDAFTNLQITPCNSTCLQMGRQDERGLQAVRDALGGTFAGLDFRPDARPNLILVTDEDSDAPTSPLPGQVGMPEPPNVIAGTDWQVEVDLTAAAVVGAGAFLNMIVEPGDVPSTDQYGDPASDVSDPETFLDFDPTATRAALTANGHGASLQAQVLDANLVARAFDISRIAEPAFVDNFFSAKVEESDEGYVFELVVSDGNTTSAPARTTVFPFASDVPPNADAGRDRNALVGAAVTLDGSGSSDPDSGPEPLGFAWSLRDSPSGSAATDADLVGADTSVVSFVPDVEGSFDVELTVSDGMATDAARATVLAHATAAPPNADAGPDRSIEVCELGGLDATATADPDTAGDALVFSWSLLGRPAGSALSRASIQNASTPRPHFQPDVEGAYVFQVDVRDPEGGVSLDQVLVEVGPPNLCAPPEDADADGIPDIFETATGTFVSPTNTGTRPGTDDSDSDGVLDGDEVAAGTDPNDPLEFPITATGDLDGNGVVDTVDLLFGLQVLRGERTLSAAELARADVAPLEDGLPASDGEFTAADLAILRRIASGELVFSEPMP